MRKKTVLGLTGNIGSGKTTAAGMFREMVLPVFDADSAVHRIMRDNVRAKEYFDRRIKGSVVDGEISRSVLSDKIRNKELDVRELEQMLWPFALEELQKFFERHSYEPLLILDVPLLYESGWDSYCDKVIVMEAPEEVLKQRVMSRPGMNEEKYALLTTRQLSQQEKCKRADFRVDSSKGFDFVRAELEKIRDELLCGK